MKLLQEKLPGLSGCIQVPEEGGEEEWGFEDALYYVVRVAYHPQLLLHPPPIPEVAIMAHHLMMIVCNGTMCNKAKHRQKARDA